MRRLLPILAVAVLPVATALPASALNGCPKGEFTSDTCVMVLPGYHIEETDHFGDRGLRCLKVVPDKKDGVVVVDPPRCADTVAPKPVAAP